MDVTLEDGTRLRFTSRPSWRTGRIVVEERYRLTPRDGTTEVHDYTFVMRPWQRDEIAARLGAAGLTDVQTRAAPGRRGADRLWVTATRSR